MPQVKGPRCRFTPWKVLKSILRDAELSPEELEKLLFIAGGRRSWRVSSRVCRFPKGACLRSGPSFKCPVDYSSRGPAENPRRNPRGSDLSLRLALSDKCCW